MLASKPTKDGSLTPSEDFSADIYCFPILLLLWATAPVPFIRGKYRIATTTFLEIKKCSSFEKNVLFLTMLNSHQVTIYTATLSLKSFRNCLLLALTESQQPYQLQIFCSSITYLIKQLLPCSVRLDGKLQLSIHGGNTHADLEDTKCIITTHAPSDATQQWNQHLPAGRDQLPSPQQLESPVLPAPCF